MLRWIVWPPVETDSNQSTESTDGGDGIWQYPHQKEDQSANGTEMTDSMINLWKSEPK